MALKVKSLVMPFGVEFNDVYFKINRIAYNDEDELLYFAGVFFINEEARRNGLQPLDTGVLCETIRIPDKTVNLYECIYNHIKAEAVRVSNMTDEEIAENNNRVEALLEKDQGCVADKINPNYRIFKDAEDC